MGKIQELLFYTSLISLEHNKVLHYFDNLKWNHYFQKMILRNALVIFKKLDFNYTKKYFFFFHQSKM